MYMNDMQRTTALAMEIGMHKAYVQILYRIIKFSIKDKHILAEADRIFAETETAKERAKAKVLEMF